MWRYNLQAAIGETNAVISVWSPKSVRGACALSPSMEQTLAHSRSPLASVNAPPIGQCLSAPGNSQLSFLMEWWSKRNAELPPSVLEWKLRRNCCIEPSRTKHLTVKSFKHLGKRKSSFTDDRQRTRGWIYPHSTVHHRSKIHHAMGLLLDKFVNILCTFCIHLDTRSWQLTFSKQHRNIVGHDN